MNKFIILLLAALGLGVPVAWTAGPFTSKVESGNCSSGDFVEGYSATGTRTCGTPAGGTPANPTATAGPTAINGTATTYMRSDAAPAVQKATSGQFGIVEVDGSTITASGGVISAASAVSGANPTATASDTAVNGSASTFMRSDGAPAIQKATSGQFGVVEVDGTTITATAGVISSAAGTSFANPSATAGPTAVNGSASTAMRSDAAPAVQQGSAAQKGIVQVDGTSITASSGVISATGVSGANPSATASDTAVNGSATTYMRSDGAPAVQKATSGQFGLVEVDGTTITAAGGVISAVDATTFANPTATAKDTAVNGVATTAMRSDAAPAIQKATSGQFGVVEVDGTTITASSGVISSVGAAGANPSGTAGPTAVNGSATTFMRSDGAPAVQQGTAAQKGIVQVDGTSITASAGVISATAGASGANPSATAGPTAVNGSASTFMRSDGAPAVQKASAAQFGIVEVDGTTITASAGVISAASGATGANPSATAGPTAVNGSASTFMRSDGAPAVQQGSSSQKGIVQVDNTTITASSGVISAVAGASSSGAGIGWIAASNPDKVVVYTASRSMTITAVRGTVDTAVGATATIQPYKTASGAACASGTALTTGTFDANGTAVTNQTLTLAGAGAPSMVAGDRICLSTGNSAAFIAGVGIGGITFEYTVP